MTTRLDIARVRDNALVRWPSGKIYAGPIWQDAEGTFCYYENRPVPVFWNVSAGEWQVATATNPPRQTAE